MSNPKAMELAVNQALQEYQAIRMRMGLLGGGARGLDAKRASAWCEYGFKSVLHWPDFYNLYSRGGIAFGAVKKLVDRCWLTKPWIISGEPSDESREETPWEKKLKREFRQVSLWRHFREADRRRLAARYSAILLHINDSQGWDKPVKGNKRLVKVTPIWQGALEPKDYDNDPNSPRYGLPTFWTYTTTHDNGVETSTDVHYDRIFLLGDWSADAIGFLEPAYNNFVSLEKVEGGSGESFLKNAARQLNINFDKEVTLSAIAAAHNVPVSELQSIFDKVTREMNIGTDAAVVTQGATVTPLTTAVADPEPTYSVNLQSAAAGVDIPTKILVGQQTGERASTEDEKYFNTRCQSRREELGAEIEEFIQHLMRLRVVDVNNEFTCMWDDLTEANVSDKLANAKVMSEINQTAMATGGPIFTDNQILTTAGFEPIPEGDTLPDEDEDEEPEPAPDDLDGQG